MDPSRQPLIIFVPGKNPKPAAEAHRSQLFRCLRVGIERAGFGFGETLASHPDWFEILSWNEVFYGRSTDITDELSWIDKMLETEGPTGKDIRDANAWRTRLAWVVYSIIDRIPALIPLIANPAIKSTIEETLVYFENSDGIGVRIRGMLQNRLQQAFEKNRPVLVIGHSMGSVIAYDALWELTHEQRALHKISQFLTIGSPLGLRFVQKRLKGADQKRSRRYPANIRSWVNISAMGELTALDREFADDYREMVQLGLLNDIVDRHKGVYNYYRDNNGLNVHRSYAYLVNPVTGRVVAEWLDRALDGRA